LCGENIYHALDHNLGELKRLGKARRLLKVANAIQLALHSETTAVENVLDYLSNELLEIEFGDRLDELATPQQQAARMLETLEEVLDTDRRNARHIYTSCISLNTATGGFEAGDLVIISGETGGGKSAFAMNCVRDIAITQNKPVLFINTEMSQKQIDLRWAALITDNYEITNTNLRNGQLTDAQLSEVMTAVGDMARSEFYLATIPDLSVAKLLATIRRFVAKHHIKAVVIDYVGRIDTMNSDKDEWRQLKSAAQKLKTLAQKLGLVIFMVAQQNSEGQLAGSKQMEYEADLHLKVRPLTEKESAKTPDYFNYALDIRKSRSSKKGVTPCRFIGDKLKFSFNATDARKHYEFCLGKKNHTF